MSIMVLVAMIPIAIVATKMATNMQGVSSYQVAVEVVISVSCWCPIFLFAFCLPVCGLWFWTLQDTATRYKIRDQLTFFFFFLHWPVCSQNAAWILYTANAFVYIYVLFIVVTHTHTHPSPAKFCSPSILRRELACDFGPDSSRLDKVQNYRPAQLWLLEKSTA